jgi:leucyl-tRNA synthetase
VPESELPLLLPEVESYEPTDDGESPLAKIDGWVNTSCPKCGAGAKRETDTMPQWAGSSWYFLRYIDPNNSKEFASKEAIDYWMPVDWYNGGMEHTTLHLLYSRFWHKFFFDIGLVTTSEPYKKRTSHGMILGENNEKMSKSRGNVVNPDDIIGQYGADTLRAYEMFIGAFELAAAWSNEGVKGCRRFLDRVWRLMDFCTPEMKISDDLTGLIHRTIKKVSHDYESLKFNTAIAALMTLTNEFYRKNSVTRAELEVLLLLLNPVCPHITEEIYEMIGNKSPIFRREWLIYDESLCKEDKVTIGVTINGKLKTQAEVGTDDAEETVRDMIHEIPAVQKVISGKSIVKEIYVPGRVYNIVVR